MFSTKKNNHRERVYLGAPEAEAESSDFARQQLKIVFEDFLDLAEQLDAEKFILLGRKGSGKSAFARYHYERAKSEANFFCSFVNKENFAFEATIQAAKSSGENFPREALFKWVILTRLIDLYTSNETFKESRYYKNLKEFLKKNRGFVDIDNDQVASIRKSGSFEVGVEKLQRIFRGSKKSELETNLTKAPFYKIIKPLETALTEALREEIEYKQQNEYVLFFDDLDIGFKAHEETDIEALLALIRTAREYNNTIFQDIGPRIKLVILLRDDIADALARAGADANKMLKSYGVTIDWYQELLLKIGKNEKELAIRKFINRRIAEAFNQCNMAVDRDDPWGSLCMVDFKSVLDLTLYRPRDLLLFFLPLEKHNFNYPLDSEAIKQLEKKYISSFVEEVRNEMWAFYKPQEFEYLFSSLKVVKTGCTWETLHKEIEQKCPTVNAKNAIKLLLDYSFLGHKSSEKDLHFKFRERDSFKYEPNNLLILQKALLKHFNPR